MFETIHLTLEGSKAVLSTVANIFSTTANPMESCVQDWCASQCFWSDYLRQIRQIITSTTQTSVEFVDLQGS